MRCEECEALLEEYFDGELKAPIAAAVTQHVNTCTACSPMLRQLQHEQHAYDHYQRDVEVSPALWSQIKSGIAEHRISNHTWWAAFAGMFSGSRINMPATAAIVMLAVGLTIGVMKYFERTGDPEHTEIAQSHLPAAEPSANDIRIDKNQSETRTTTPVAIAPQPRPKRKTIAGDRKGPVTAAQLVRQAERKYLNAIDLLTRDVSQHPSAFDEEARARLDRALAAIDRTIAATRKAVKRNPDDPVAIEYMLSAYRKKVDVLREMTSHDD